MQIYSKNNKNCFSLISWPIFILFVLSDSARAANRYEKNRICYEILKGIRKYESASKKYDFSVIRNRMLPPFISDRKSKHPTFILA